ncbi:hypothetical protein R3P38DRAFT_3234581 [Favolaschia claudopus]|uniref:Apple domain-containing protein n=1 Tax=Favolaschia claudopus TaxID=2862362 RepID=A0AAV9ZFG3_9AGAR
MLPLLTALLLSSVAWALKPTPAAGTVFAVYPGWDMDNGSLQTIFNGTEKACLQSCTSSATCVAYAYIPYGHGGTDVNPICVLKSSIDPSMFKQQSFDLSVGLVGGCGTFSPAGPTICRTVSV